MTDLRSRLGDPSALAGARAAAHAAAQLLTRAARANLRAAPDDSHSNLEWSAANSMFLTCWLGEGATRRRAGLGLTPLRLVVMVDGGGVDELALAGRTAAQSMGWLDEILTGTGLAAAGSLALPYDLPAEVADIDRFGADDPGLAALAAWFSLAARSLEDFAAAIAAIEPGPSPVRTWPHHFDIATYVSLEPGDPETARGVGVGFSPGDERYDRPYFYVNPWPQLVAGSVPAPVSPGHWHTEGFVGSVATAQAILTGADPVAAVGVFLRGSFEKSLKALGLPHVHP